MKNGTSTVQDMLDCLSRVGVSLDDDPLSLLLFEATRKEPKPQKPYMDILGAVKAVNTFTPASKAIKTFALTEAQADDLYAHIEGCERILLGHWPRLTREEANSLYGEDYANWRQDTLYCLKRCKGKVVRPPPE